MGELYHSKGEPKVNPDGLNLSGSIEALLFAYPSSLTISQIATILDVAPSEVEHGLSVLESDYLDNMRGIRLQRHDNRVTLTSAPEAAEWIERLMEIEVSGYLSRAALETLAIIAYTQPATRPEIDAIRGVNSDGVVRNLQAKGLINEVGRANSPGRPILYSTSAEFLEHFGLGSLHDLPPLDIESRIEEGDTLDED